MARVIPVIDVMGGRVVRAAGGRRAEYRPVESRLTASTAPVEVARAMVHATGADEVYVADLDAIRHGTPGDVRLVRQFAREGVEVWVDPGVRTADDAYPYLEAGGRVVVGTETVRGPGEFARLGVRATLSVDLRAGQLVGDWAGWGVPGPGAVADLIGVAIGLGLGSLILLDVARVGSGGGPGTEGVLRQVRDRFEDWCREKGGVLTGGGVSGAADVTRLGRLGFAGVLVSSALHDGRIRPGELVQGVPR